MRHSGSILLPGITLYGPQARWDHTTDDAILIFNADIGPGYLALLPAWTGCQIIQDVALIGHTLAEVGVLNDRIAGEFVTHRAGLDTVEADDMTGVEDEVVERCGVALFDRTQITGMPPHIVESQHWMPDRPATLGSIA